jgi:formylglycine-generating enzyme required for sulfatase activity
MFKSNPQNQLASWRYALFAVFLSVCCGLAGCQQIMDRVSGVARLVNSSDEETRAEKTELFAKAISVPEAESKIRQTFQDCDTCPLMVALPAGVFQMGSPESEAGRDVDEAPRIDVAVAAFAIGQTEVTRTHWAEFERDSGHRAASGCLTWDGDGYVNARHLGWRYPGFPQSDEHPVVCVNWHDAHAYAQWMSRKTGHLYRLPLEYEWEYAARAGTQSPYPWGTSASDVCNYANGADAALTMKHSNWPTQTCHDGFAFTSPVGSFVPNAWGLYDMHGNVMEWVQDCWGTQIVIPGTGTAPLNCRSQVIRGGGWDLSVNFLRSAFRGKAPPLNQGTSTGFRLVRKML